VLLTHPAGLNLKVKSKVIGTYRSKSDISAPRKAAAESELHKLDAEVCRLPRLAQARAQTAGEDADLVA